MNHHRLYRSGDDRLIAGVAGGLAEYFEIDPVLVRILWFISVPITGGLTFLAYIVMMIVVPIEPEEWPQPSPWAPGGGPTDHEATYTPPAASATGPAPEGGAPEGAPPGLADAGTPSAAPGAAPYSASAAPTDWRWQRRQERWQYRADRWEHRGEHRGTGAIVFGLLLIVLGGAFAWNQIDPRFNLSLAWPVAIMAVGAILILSSVGRARHD